MGKRKIEVQKAGKGGQGQSTRARTLDSDIHNPTAGSNNLPSWIPAALFGGLTLFLFRSFIFTDQMLVGNDTLSLGYVARAFYADALTQLGAIPGWAPLILGGTPFLEA